MNHPIPQGNHGPIWRCKIVHSKKSELFLRETHEKNMKSLAWKHLSGHSKFCMLHSCVPDISPSKNQTTEEVALNSLKRLWSTRRFQLSSPNNQHLSWAFCAWNYVCQSLMSWGMRRDLFFVNFKFILQTMTSLANQLGELGLYIPNISNQLNPLQKNIVSPISSTEQLFRNISLAALSLWCFFFLADFLRVQAIGIIDNWAERK